MTASSRSRFWSASPPHRPSRTSNARLAKAGGDPRRTKVPPPPPPTTTSTSPLRLRRLLKPSNWRSRHRFLQPLLLQPLLLQPPRLGCPMETALTPSSRLPPTTRSGSSRCRKLRFSPAMLSWEVTYSFAIMTRCRRILNASSLAYLNVTGTLCAPFNQGFPFFCTIIPRTSFMGSSRLRVLEVRT